MITLTKAKGQKSFLELQSIKKEELLEKEKNENIYKEFKNIFPDAELIDVSKKE